MNTSNSQLFKRLWGLYVRAYWPQLLLALAFMLGVALSTATLAQLMRPVIDDVFKDENGQKLQWIAAVIFLTFIIKGICSYGESITISKIGHRILARLQQDLMSHLLHADLSFYFHHSSGSLISLYTHNMNALRSMITHALTSVGKDTFTALGLIGVMIYQDPFLALIALIILPLAFWPLIRLGKKLRRISGSTQFEAGGWTSLLTELFQGIRLIKSYTLEKKMTYKSYQMIDSLRDLMIRASRARSLASPLMETFGGVAIVVVITYGGYQVIGGYRTAGAFFSFITALLMAYEPLKRLAGMHAALQEGLSAADQIFMLMDKKPRVVSAPDAPPLVLTRGHIFFDDIFFAYNHRPVFEKFSLDIPAGKVIALVGPSGGGKSTILNLIPRFFDVQSGHIFIDGENIAGVDLTSLRNQIALVSQDIILFDDTICANIGYGRIDASFLDIVEAAKNASAHEFILALPDGYETRVGEDGHTLSGGQRQRIAIARAFLKNAPILLLDEATSALDTASERHIQGALKKLMHGRTSVVVAHRLSTVQHADLIYVIHQGTLIESGTHTQLYQANGLYAQLCHKEIMA